MSLRQIPPLQGEIDGALADFYAGKQQARKADLWYRKSIRSFEEQRAAVRDEELRLPFFANGDALYRRYADFLIASRKPDDALQLLDIGRARTLAEGLGLAKQQPDAHPENTVDVQAVARKLNAAILFYSLGAEKSYLWAVTPHRTSLFLLPAQVGNRGPGPGISESHPEIERPAARGKRKPRRLSTNTLVGPAAAMIPKGSKVFIIPDGVLNGLNFETLLAPGADSSHYWIEDVTVTQCKLDSPALQARPELLR